MILAVIVADIPYLPFLKWDTSSVNVEWYNNYYLGVGEFINELAAIDFDKKELDKLEESMHEIVPDRANIKVIVISKDGL